MVDTLFLHKKESDKKSVFKDKLIILFLCCVILMFCFINYAERKNYNKLSFEAKKIMYDIKTEKAKKSDLSRQKNIYNSDSYVEKIARQKLGMIKSDEIVFYVESDLELNEKNDGEK